MRLLTGKAAFVEQSHAAPSQEACLRCGTASIRYHDEVRVFSRLMANSVVGNND